MSAYKDALSIGANASGQQLELAAQILASGQGVVVLDNTVAVHTTPAYLICEVIDPAPTSRLCEHEFSVLVENARRMLTSSQLCKHLPGIPQKWRVVEDNGSGTVQWWQAP